MVKFAIRNEKKNPAWSRLQDIESQHSNPNLVPERSEKRTLVLYLAPVRNKSNAHFIKIDWSRAAREHLTFTYAHKHTHLHPKSAVWGLSSAKCGSKWPQQDDCALDKVLQNKCTYMGILHLSTSARLRAHTRGCTPPPSDAIFGGPRYPRRFWAHHMRCRGGAKMRFFSGPIYGSKSHWGVTTSNAAWW